MTITFHKGSLKLAGLYLAIVMTISLFFSGIVLQLSSQELRRGLLRPVQGFELQISGGYGTGWRDQLMAERQEQYNDATHRVVQRLVILNMLILVGGGLLCYYLALRTLRPIEQAHDALERFTADASHELRTPLTVMRSENEVALMDPGLTLAKAKEQIKSNIEELEKLSSLSEGLLKIASSETADLVREEALIDELLQEARDRVLPLAEKKGILITSKSNAKRSIAVDRAGIVEVLVILLDNAIKYSPKHSEIKLRAEEHPKELVIKVEDKGLGIKSSELPHIFDRFYRADTARSKQEAQGYGLGLAIAKGIIEKHAGSISAKSLTGKGTTFTVKLSY